MLATLIAVQEEKGSATGFPTKDTGGPKVYFHILTILKDKYINIT